MLETTLTPPRPRPTATPLLELHSINAAYGKSPVLWGVDLEIKPGEAVALLGAMGWVKPRCSEPSPDFILSRAARCIWTDRM